MFNMSNKKINLLVLVGAPGSGKTTFLNKMKQKGYAIFNSDAFIHNVLYVKGGAGYKFIKRKTGKNYITNTSVNRSKLYHYCLINRPFLYELSLLCCKHIVHILSKKRGQKILILEYPLIAEFLKIFQKFNIKIKFFNKKYENLKFKNFFSINLSTNTVDNFLKNIKKYK